MNCHHVQFQSMNPVLNCQPVTLFMNCRSVQFQSVDLLMILLCSMPRPLGAMDALSVSCVSVFTRSQSLPWSSGPSAPPRWSSTPVWWSSAPPRCSSTQVWWSSAPSAPPWWAPVPYAPPWWAPVPSSPPWLPALPTSIRRGMEVISLWHC